MGLHWKAAMKTLTAVVQSVLFANRISRSKGLVRGKWDMMGRTNCVGCYEPKNTPIEDV